ncbi:phosphatase PAP2 family protein [Neolewinella antarctica]|uniref:Membrane-associated phospholipid phosphatase n=1 Tax=Neolewinella antarctica TaxID=442734 RepID=A0ABX0X7V3_9BACT|nr:phosphatase PAP2 family protein [Neolewinella antarctica]NJC24948.1 membrane-associated phospholipid phosphatase [Neolewinella antarctica]
MDNLPPDGQAEQEPVSFFRHNWLFLVATLLLVVASLYLLFTSQQGDTLIVINQYRSVFFDYFFKIGTHFGEPVAYAGVVAIVGAFSYRKALFAVLTGAAAGVLAGVLKLCFAEARPLRWFFDNHEATWHSLNHFEEEWRSWAEVGSFPSGHTASAFALYSFLSFNARSGKLPITLFCLALAAMVGFSRMYLLYHFLRDVTAGAVLGVTVAIVVYYWQDKLFANHAILKRGWATRFRTLPPVTEKVSPPEA